MSGSLFGIASRSFPALKPVNTVVRNTYVHGTVSVVAVVQVLIVFIAGRWVSFKSCRSGRPPASGEADESSHLSVRTHRLPVPRSGHESMDPGSAPASLIAAIHGKVLAPSGTRMTPSTGYRRNQCLTRWR